MTEQAKIQDDLDADVLAAKLAKFLPFGSRTCRELVCGIGLDKAAKLKEWGDRVFFEDDTQEILSIIFERLKIHSITSRGLLQSKYPQDGVLLRLGENERAAAWVKARQPQEANGSAPKAQEPGGGLLSTECRLPDPTA